MNAQSPFDPTPGMSGTDAGASRWNGSQRMDDSDMHGVDADASTGSLLRQLMHEGAALLGKELALARSEMRENLEESRRGLTAAAGGGVVLAGGYFVLLFAAVYALSNVMAPWAAALIVGVVAAAIGYAMLKAGMKRVQARELRPERAIHSLRKDTDAIRGTRNDYH